MIRLILLAIFFCSTAFAEDTMKLEVTTNDMTAVGVPYVDAQRFVCEDTETQKECYERNKPEIDSEKAKRIANFEDAIKNPPAPVEPTKEELLKEQQAILEQKAQMDVRVAEITTKVAEIDAKPKAAEDILEP